MTLDPTLLRHLDDDEGEALAEGGTWLLDLVAAVDHLRRGACPGLTVWDAIGEATRWTVEEPARAPAEADAVVIHAALVDAVASSEVLQVAIRRWVVAMAERYNDGHHWPHPAARRSFPPPLLERDDS
jgi:hypothetical protein